MRRWGLVRVCWVDWAERVTGPAERLLWPGRASPSASQLLAFSPGKEQAAGVPGVGDGQGGLTCCGSWGRKESDT